VVHLAVVAVAVPSSVAVVAAADTVIAVVVVAAAAIAVAVTRLPPSVTQIIPGFPAGVAAPKAVAPAVWFLKSREREREGR